MKTTTLIWLGAGGILAFYLYNNATITVSSDFQPINSAANLPKSFNVAEILARSRRPEPQLIRLKFSL